MSQIIFGGKLTFNESKHRYEWDGKLVPGVTTILQCISKPALIQWSAGMASDYWLAEIKNAQNEKRLECFGLEDFSKIHKEAKVAHRKKVQAAADSGSSVHEYAEAFIKKTELPELDNDEVKRGVEAFHKWLDAHKVKFMASERRIFSKEHWYAGTCDFVAEIDGEIAVGDFKTSSGIYPEMRFQVAAYQHAIQEEKGVQFQRREIIRFDKKTGEFEAKTFRDFALDFSGFKAALDLHRALKAIEEN